jgi:trigger factor
METSIKKLPKSQVEILFELSAEEFNPFIEKAILELVKDSKIKGFRKGKVPREVAIEKIGKEKILALAMEIAVRESYFQAIKDNKIEAISKPEIEIKSSPDFGKGLTFKAKLSVLPEVHLPEYKEIAASVKRKKVLAEEKEIQDALLWLQKSRSKFILKNEPAQFKDLVEIEFSSPQIENNRERKDRFILGEGRLVKGFEEQLTNMSSGEEKSFSLVLSSEHHRKELAGKEVHFKVRMKLVQKVIPPQINDEFAKNLGKFKDLKELKKSIEEGILQEKENQESQRVRQEILGKIVKETKIDIPQALVDAEKKKIFEDFKKLILARLKISFEDYLAKVKKTEEEFSNTFSKEAERKVKHFLALREIANKEKLEVSEEEVKKAINEVLRHYPSVEKAKKELDLAQMKDYYENVIKNEKTLQFLENFAK